MHPFFYRYALTIGILTLVGSIYTGCAESPKPSPQTNATRAIPKRGTPISQTKTDHQCRQGKDSKRVPITKAQKKPWRPLLQPNDIHKRLSPAALRERHQRELVIAKQWKGPKLSSRAKAFRAALAKGLQEIESTFPRADRQLAKKTLYTSLLKQYFPTRR